MRRHKTAEHLPHLQRSDEGETSGKAGGTAEAEGLQLLPELLQGAPRAGTVGWIAPCATPKTSACETPSYRTLKPGPLG